MSYQINLQSDDAYRWLRQAMETLARKAVSNPAAYCDSAPHITNIIDALEDATHTREPSEAPVPTKTTAHKTAPSPAPALCKNHPTYTAQRSPRRDCETCWAVYERLNPTRAALARRRFQRQR